MTFKTIKPIVFVLMILLCTASTAAQQQKKRGDAVAPRDNRSYSMGPQDLITIRVFDVPELNTTVRISGSGTITLPLLGEVTAGGLTPAQLERRLAEQLEKSFIKKARVTVFIDEYRSQQIAVMGAVGRPGNLELPGRETLLQAISRAGGLTDRAGKTVVLIRGSDSHVIDIDKLMNSGDPTLNMQLEAGDIINVPHERYIDIYIFGQVRRPGTLQMKKSGNITLLKVIAQAGGFTDRARKSSVTVTRTGKDGKKKKFKLNVKKILKGKKPAFVLQHDDIIFVPESLL